MAKRKTAEQRLAALIDEIGIERVESFVRFLKACGETAGVKIASPKRSKTDQVDELNTAVDNKRKTRKHETALTGAEDLFKAGKKEFEQKAMSAAGTAAGASNRITVE